MFITDNFFSWILFKAFDGIYDGIYDKFQSKKQIRALSDKINGLLNKKREEFEDVSLTDEFDFQGLEEFIKNNLSGELTLFFRGTQQQRKQSQEIIISKATNYASAKFPDAKNKVRSIIEQVLQIINEYYQNQIDTVTRINTNMAVDELKQIIDDSTQDIKEQISNIPNNNHNLINDAIYSRKLDILKAIEKYELSEYRLDISPRKVNHNNPEISKAEMGVLFNSNPNILTDFYSLISHIDETDKQISDILKFYDGYCEPDGYGGWRNNVWERICYYEGLMEKPYCSDDTIKEFEEYCNRNTYNEYRSELDEYKKINYYNAQRRINDISVEFNIIKERLILLIREDING